MAKNPGTAGAFDIRTIIGLLFGIYAVVLIAVGATAGAEDVVKTDGININLWVGIGMLVFAAALVGWARLRPIAVPDGDEAHES
ncbi:hypothetical protein [Saccharopolyspora phatthalungensis]|uniref:Uncharacterized protein n=1 Tax=Saccharopolyspora phatthalungensis TaxID=664693 RepID=A0A840QJK2_9PSEU|nr:hypothetical protein [Saccharopolyspora phatthalungensis]MBB5158053.1 hypothetical protein [Saccharopolyspora phatthalungensis]